jgi:hypothetical protein
MTVVFRKIGLLAFAAALACGAQQRNDVGTKAPQKLPYRVNDPQGLSPPKPQPRQDSQISVLQGDKQLTSDVPSSKIPTEFGRKSSDLKPAIDHPVPQTPNPQKPRHAPVANTEDFVPPNYQRLEQNSPSPAEGLNPLLAVAFVGVGSILGLSGSIFIVKYQLAGRLAARPNGDLLRKKLFAKSTPADNLPPHPVKTNLFQLQSAMRRKLISPDEFRDLRSKYLVPANFSFSLLVPTLLALAYFSIGATNWWAAWVMSAVGSVVTALLTTYALDRRHQFRSEYRTLIVENAQSKPVPNVGAPSERGGEGVSTEEFARALAIMSQIAAAFRPSATGGGTPKPTVENSE